MHTMRSRFERALPLYLWSLCSLAPLAAIAAGGDPGASPLPARECLDPHVAVDFKRIDADHLAVKTTRGAFRLDLADPCLDLIGQARLQFRSARADNRICGLLGEYVVLPDGGSCRIGAITPMSAEDYGNLGTHIMRDPPAR